MGVDRESPVLAARHERRVAVSPTHADCWTPSSVEWLSVGLQVQSNKNNCVEEEIPVQPGQSAARRWTKRDRVRRRRSCLYIICLMSVCVVCLRTDSARGYCARCRATAVGRAPWLLRVVLHHGGDVSDWRALSGVVEMCPPPVNNPPTAE